MDDLISRQVLLAEKFASLECALQANKDANFDVYKRGWNDALQTVYDNAPSVQQWIPCSERLPDSQEDVLCDEDGHVILGFYTDEEIGWHDTHSYRIYPTAWMPLPSPYREEVSD